MSLASEPELINSRKSMKNTKVKLSQQIVRNDEIIEIKSSRKKLYVH
jgi:hypothetical protein